MDTATLASQLDVFRATVVIVQILATGACSIGTGVALYVLLSYRVKQLERKFDNGINAKIDALDTKFESVEMTLAGIVATCRERWAVLKGKAANAE